MIALRRALVVQGVLLAGWALATSAIAGYMTVNPPACRGFCLNLLPLSIFFFGLPLALPAIVIGLLAWRWRQRRLWPVAVLIVTDISVVAFVWVAVSAYPSAVVDPAPAVGLLPVLVAVPAVVTSLLAVNVLRPIPWVPLAGMGAAVSLILGLLVAVNVIGPPHQEIPGELPLSFNKTVVYEGRDLGCTDRVQGWVDEHSCRAQALVVYRGSGDPYADQLTIDRAVADPTRYSPTQGKVQTLPVDEPFGRSYTGRIDYRNEGGCLMIIDRLLQAPPQPASIHCGTAGDYADIRAHWPRSDAYAIGIIYWYTRPG